MRAKILALGLVCLIITNCAASFKSRPITRSVKFNTEPQGAKIYVNGNYMGETPISIRMESKKNYVIELKKEGYKTKTLDMTHYWTKLQQTTVVQSSLAARKSYQKKQEISQPGEILKVNIKLEKKQPG